MQIASPVAEAATGLDLAYLLISARSGTGGGRVGARARGDGGRRDRRTGSDASVLAAPQHRLTRELIEAGQARLGSEGNDGSRLLTPVG